MEFDFTGVNPRNPLVSFNPEPGPYKCKIVGVDPAYNGGKSTKFEMDVLVGPSPGITVSKFIGNEEGEKGGNKANWLGALCAVAPDPDKFLAMAKAGMKFNPAVHAAQTFTGKTIHALVIEEPGTDSQGRPNLPRIEFLTAAQYAQVVAAHAASGKAPARAQAPASNGAPASTPATAGTPATPAAGGDVLKDLFAT